MSQSKSPVRKKRGRKETNPQSDMEGHDCFFVSGSSNYYYYFVNIIDTVNLFRDPFHF